MSEIWKPVPGYEDRYDVSDQGRIRGWYRTGIRQSDPHILLPGIGTHVVTLVDEKGLQTKAKVGELVLLAFGSTPRPGTDFYHKNGDKRDNRLANLAWAGQ